MRRVEIIRGDFPLFHQDINPLDYEFFRTHSAAFKRMWNEQRRSFWSVFLDTYDDFIWNYGVMKDFPLEIDDKKRYISEILGVLRADFVDGNASSAKGLVMDCVILAQNRHHVGSLDKASYSQNPFYMKETRETFRKLFGPPKSKSTFVKLLCGIPVYVKFAGAAVNVLRRWLSAKELDDEYLEKKYLEDLSRIRLLKDDSTHSREDVLRDRIVESSLFDILDPELTLMLDELAPPKQKMIFTQTSDDDPNNLKIVAVGNGPIKMANSLPSDRSGDKKKKKKKKSKPPKAIGAEAKTEESSEKKEEKPDIRPDQLIDLKRDPGIFVQKVDCDSDLIMPDGRVMKPPFTFIIGKGEKPDPAILKASLDKYNAEEEMLKQELEREELEREMERERFVLEKVAGQSLCTEIDESAGAKYKRHHCGKCGKLEEDVKAFKRCVKCRGRKNPKYYCSRECQVNDWKAGHRLEHKDDLEDETTG